MSIYPELSYKKKTRSQVLDQLIFKQNKYNA